MTNLRTDEYGGSIENRARFLFEVLESVLEMLESKMVGIKIAPMHEAGPFAANDETLPTIEYVISRLNDYSLSHLLMMGASTDFSGSPLTALAGDGIFQHFRPIFKGPLIAQSCYAGLPSEWHKRRLGRETGYGRVSPFRLGLIWLSP